MSLYDYNQPNDELKALIGKTVTVYRGGPESKTGKLVDVQVDYLALANENEASIIYYVMHHVQSISENARANSLPSFSSSNNTIEPVRAKSFKELLCDLISRRIKINQGGPESKQGTLLDVNDDHIVLFTEDDGVVFYHLQHIKSIYVQMEKEEDITEENDETTELEKATNNVPPYVKTPNFSALFTELTHTWVSINRGGPEAIEGILVPEGDGYCTVFNGDEIIRMNPNHIKSISCGPKGAFQGVIQQQNEQSTEKAEEKAGKEEKKQEAHGDKKKDEGKEKGEKEAKAQEAKGGKEEPKKQEAHDDKKKGKGEKETKAQEKKGKEVEGKKKGEDAKGEKPKKDEEKGEKKHDKRE
ncbi:spore coat protein CotH [Anoxybacillus sp. LAT_35]|uniref:spore coat protein CotH n=1 Tax=unclassified Anoxybacillus TaxID=2639704 RepID=UPI001EDC20AB|nr:MULTISPECIES: spore coat protein CotH [unclassified Anoxybacillus]MCG5026102.1 spore coat protein CotH [Anoxybacillus flavithermus]MCG3084177.1 spore coat protein CotH [Anoxybacillus sp. LAT27]MCG6170596.1 spore coat protein CotH [Anoxybacillus sp. LAT_11]MCG6174737.1 spore coat protein CotH [Anoxybacillus sp. LAT_31]MCG6177690.1 spore coat protein CotH [Anoxybacillus sp. LAT_35]